MSFGESVFLAGFNHKTTKEDLFVKGNYGILPRKQRGKTLEDSKRLSTEVEPVPLTCGAGRPHLQAGRPVGPHVSLLLLCQFSTTLRIASPPFIQVGLIRGLRINALAYTPTCTPSSRALAFDPESLRSETLIHMSTRIRASNQEKISPQ